MDWDEDNEERSGKTALLNPKMSSSSPGGAGGQSSGGSVGNVLVLAK